MQNLNHITIKVELEVVNGIGGTWPKNSDTSMSCRERIEASGEHSSRGVTIILFEYELESQLFGRTNQCETLFDRGDVAAPIRGNFLLLFP
jgi:hypothetical protein